MSGPSKTEMLGGLMRSLFVFPKPIHARFWVAVRAAVSLGVPAGILTVLGYESVGAQAAAGSFVALFLSNLSALERAKTLPFVGVAIFLSAALGVLLSPWMGAMLVGLAVVAVVAALGMLGFRLGPPGAMFFVLVYGLAASTTSVHDGARLHDPLVFLAAATGGLVFSYLIALLPLLLRRERERPTRPLSELIPRPVFGALEREMTMRIAVVAVVGAAIGPLLVNPYQAYWIVTGGVAALGVSPRLLHSLERGLHRMVGTLLGCLLYMLLSPIVDMPLVLVLALMVLQFMIELVVTKNYALALFFVTPLVFLMIGAGSGVPITEGAMWARIGDTAIGALLAVASGLVIPRSIIQGPAK